MSLLWPLGWQIQPLDCLPLLLPNLLPRYYGLHQYFVDWNEYFIVGIAGTMAMLGKDAVHLSHKLIKQKVGQEKC